MERRRHVGAHGTRACDRRPGRAHHVDADARPPGSPRHRSLQPAHRRHRCRTASRPSSSATCWRSSGARWSCATRPPRRVSRPAPTPATTSRRSPTPSGARRRASSCASPTRTAPRSPRATSAPCGSARERSCRGYWRDPEQTAKVITPDGWLVTGDLGWVGDDGDLRLVGRHAEMYIRGGYNVYPGEVENTLGAHPAIASCAVLGGTVPVLGEIGVAFVVPAPGHDAPTLDELRRVRRRSPRRLQGARRRDPDGRTPAHVDGQGRQAGAQAARRRGRRRHGCAPRARK